MNKFVKVLLMLVLTLGIGLLIVWVFKKLFK